MKVIYTNTTTPSKEWIKQALKCDIIISTTKSNVTYIYYKNYIGTSTVYYTCIKKDKEQFSLYSAIINKNNLTLAFNFSTIPITTVEGVTDVR